MSEPLDLSRRLDPREFRDVGYLQEVNRRLLHPLGLALAYDPEGAGEGLYVVDDRDDPEGIVFVWDEHEEEARAKTQRVDAEWMHRARARFEALGYIVQEPPE